MFKYDPNGLDPNGLAHAPANSSRFFAHESFKTNDPAGKVSAHAGVRQRVHPFGHAGGELLQSIPILKECWS